MAAGLGAAPARSEAGAALIKSATRITSGSRASGLRSRPRVSARRGHSDKTILGVLVASRRKMYSHKQICRPGAGNGTLHKSRRSIMIGS